MKNHLLAFIAFFGLTALLTSCKKDQCQQTVSYWKYTPVYMTMAEIRSEVKVEAARALKNPGKIYLKGNYLFINEVQKGIHVIDNSNPASPQNVSFINIPGNIDIAAKDNVLYADCFSDLLALDISNPQHVTVLKITEAALPQPTYNYSYTVVPDKQIVRFDSVRISEKTDCNQTSYMRGGGIFYETNLNTATSSSSTSAPSMPGLAGSLARFAVTHNTLYIVDETALNVYDVSNAANPTKVTKANLGRDIETIFPYQNHLFIGSTTGMQIFNIDNPQSPVYNGTYSHGTSCDPVVVEGNTAYVTLHSGEPCHWNINQLEVVDISDPSTPTLKATYQMNSPHGLGIDNGTLFICDGSEGLKVYNASDIMTIANHMIGHFGNIQASDVIPYNKNLIMIGSDGLYEYDYSNPANITLSGKIAIEK